MDKTIRRGDVWFYKPTAYSTGHVQRGPRPVVIVSNDKLNSTSDVVLAVPCTSQIKRNFPTHALFIMNGKVNVALTEQVGPVNVNELSNLMYTLEEYVMEQINQALNISLSFKPVPGNNQNRVANLSPEPVHKPVESVDKKPIENQVTKFYNRYPNLKPQQEKDSHYNKWTDEMSHQLVSEYEQTTNRESLAKKYNLSVVTLGNYYRKFKRAFKKDN